MILVTGATGLLGSHLVLHLAEKGMKISALYRNENSIHKTKDVFKMYNKESFFENINWIPGDINDIPSLEIAFKNINYVYHCAAKISFDPRDEELVRKANIEGTANIVNFCLAKNVTKICYVSSIAALGDLPDFTPEYALANDSIQLDEETEWNPEKPHSDYAISKYGAEMEIWRGQQEGLKVVIVNPGVILGSVPKSWNREEGSYNIITRVANGMKFYTTGTTGFVGVWDVVNCITQLMDSNYAGNRYILVSENLTYQAITILIANHLNVVAPKIEARKWMTALAWRLDWIIANLFFQKRTITKALAKTLHSKDSYSNKKIKNQLNFNFAPLESVVAEIAKTH